MSKKTVRDLFNFSVFLLIKDFIMANLDELFDCFDNNEETGTCNPVVLKEGVTDK